MKVLKSKNQLICIILCLLIVAGCDKAAEKQPPNVLFISVDDLRPELNAYGVSQVISPNIDRLASTGTLFTRAYSQSALCMPSRSSLLSGVRPEHFNNEGTLSPRPIEENIPEAITMPQTFKSHGYQTVSIGKIYHHNGEDEKGWTRRYEKKFEKYSGAGYVSGYHSEEHRSIVYRYLQAWSNRSLMDSIRPPAVEMVEKPDSITPDGKIARIALEELNRLHDADSPFFLAVGFYRPHLPFTPPKKYWDLYDRNAIDTASNPFLPVNGIGFTDSDELRRYGDMPRSEPIGLEKARELKHGYYASVSFIDAQIGLILDELERLGESENTIVVLLGDHGYNLGEHTLWCKHTNYEVSTRTALIIKTPSMSEKRMTDALVGLIDIYPTLAELCQLRVPGNVEGTSLVPILTNQKSEVQSRVFSLYFDSYSMRTDQYRFTRYFEPTKIRNSSIGDSLGMYEIYDHLIDPNENRNIAYDPGNEGLLEQLKDEMNTHGHLPHSFE